MPSSPPSHIVELLRQMDLAGIAVSATVTDKGVLGGVDGLAAKIQVARRCTAPAIHTVVLAEEQRAEVERIDPAVLADDPHAGFRVILARDLPHCLER